MSHTEKTIQLHNLDSLDTQIRSVNKTSGDSEHFISQDDQNIGNSSSQQEYNPASSQLTHRFKKKDAYDEAEVHTRLLMYQSEKDPDAFPDGGLQAYLVLLGCFIGLIPDFGIANCLGAIESYVSTHQLENVKQTSISWVFSLHLGVMYFGGVIFGEIFDRYGARPLLISGMLLMCGGLMCTALSTTVAQFILSFGLVTAIGTSMAMSPLIGVLSHWFLVKRGLACSIATIGGLVGASVFAVMLQQLYLKVGFPWAIRILSFICFFCMMISIILVKERNPQRKTANKSFDNSKTKGGTKAILHKIVNFFKNALDFSIIKDKRFILLTLSIFLAEVISMSTLTYLSSYSLANGVENSTSYLLITIVNVCGIPSRLIAGYSADKLGRFNVMIATSVMTTIVIFSLWLPAKGNTSILYAFSVFFGISTSAVISLIPACTGQICSADKFGKVYGTIYFFLAILTLLGLFFSSLIIGDQSKSSYRNFILFEGALSIASIILWVSARTTAVGWKWCRF